MTPMVQSVGETPPIPSFGDLVATYTDDPDDPPITEIVSLAAALVAGDDPWRLISYVAGLGIVIKTLDDFLTINDDETEEELHAWPCREGIALSIASEGAWILFVE